jgi:LPS sulfotransferase NodH
MASEPQVNLRSVVRDTPALRKAARRVLRTARQWAARSHARELWTYGRAAAARTGNGSHARNKIRFIVYGQGRSGTSLLLDLLRSHPDIHCDSEILSRRSSGRLLSPARYIRAKAFIPPGRAYGCKVKIYELTEQQGLSDPNAFLRGLADDGWKVIHLTRTNLFRKAVSLVLAKERGRFTERRDQGEDIALGRWTLDPDEVVTAMRERHRYDLLEAEALDGVPHLSFTYEEDLLRTERHDPTCARIFEHLGLEPVPVATRLVRTSTDRVRDYVGNYDELIAAVRAVGLEVPAES